MTLSAWLVLGAGLFCIGVYGILTRRNAIGLLASVEVMANAVNLLLVAFGRYHGTGDGQVFALFTTALTVTEAAVGLALVILLYRSRKGILVDSAAELRG
ncbi:MAG: NADH-quinone oxidoreductase subunit NuoK [Myxococcales bacterium]|nr:NADH-quinone oxidoreductase subunit NuoK [Myxococcales bacterium]MCB9538510.1 NADH-quinone oxidoreductase subunit NuoK [Myxococcales bacterium]